MFATPLILATLIASEKPVPVPVPPVPARVQAVPAGRGVILQAPPPPPPPVPVAVPLQVDLRPGKALLSGSGSVGSGGPPDETVLQMARIGNSDEQLLAFFRRRTPPMPAREQLTALVKELSNKDPAQRDKAQAHLTAIGLPAAPLLRPLANSTEDLDAAARARLCLQYAEGPAAAQLVTQAARLLALRKPAGAAEVLIGYLPYCEDEAVFAEIETALIAVAVREGKPDSALVQALKDPLTVRRGLAASVLCQAAGPAVHAAIRPLLRDARASVRLRAALGLVGTYDSEAVGVLIELLAELPPNLRDQAEGYLTRLAGEWAVSGPTGNDPFSRRLRREVWAAWWKNTEGPGLLEEFRSRTFSEVDRLQVAALLSKLSGTEEERESAITALVALGKIAVGPLRRLAQQGDPRLTPLVLRCLDGIEKDSAPPLPTAAARLLALRRPEGTVETLLGYLPFCESEDLNDQILDILSRVAIVEGKVHPALVKALEDPAPQRRSGAALVLTRLRDRENLPALRALLRDPDRSVAFGVAKALLSMGDRAAVPVLIGLLRELPLELAWDAEELLIRLAGEKSPGEILTVEATSRAKVVEAWNRWWADNEKTVDLSRLDNSRGEQGLLLVVENWNPALGRGRVLELDSLGKIRWEMTGLQWPNTAQLVRGGNVLVIEQQNRLSERDRTGKVVGLDRTIPNVFHAERLRDGSTFVAARNQILILDRTGKETFTYNFTVNPILAVRRFNDGSFAFVTYSGLYNRLDSKGKLLRTCNLNWFNRSPSGAEILPGDRVILSDQNGNRVQEFDADGRIVWDTPVMTPLAPTISPSGHVLVPANNQQSIVEIDRKGKIVKEYKGLSYRPFRVQRR